MSAERVIRALGPIMIAARRTEEIARDASRRQSDIAPTTGLRHALLQQSRQESTHAAGFAAASSYLGPATAPHRMLQALEELGARLDADLDAGDLGSSMIGLQYVLEGLGSIALEPPPGDLAKIGDKFVPLRKMVLHQEQGHRRLGEVWVPRIAAMATEQQRARMEAAGRDYATIAHSVVEAGLPLLADLNTDYAHYERASRSFIANLFEHPLVAPPVEELT